MECDGLPLIMFWLLRGIKVAAVTLFCRPSLEFLNILKSQLFYYSLRNDTLAHPQKVSSEQKRDPPFVVLTCHLKVWLVYLMVGSI
jgi:hypothetical protein